MSFPGATRVDPSVPAGPHSDDPESAPNNEGDECDDTAAPQDDDYEPL
jgi:hypothetical protein